MKTYGWLALLAALTTVLIGVHGSWLWGGSVLLVLIWGYAIAVLLFKRPNPKPFSLNFVPGDADNLDQLYHRAIQYCNDIIEHYQDTRHTTRRYYILSQILIASLSGLTPILVLIDRDEALKTMLPVSLQGVLTWAMLISPGIAAVLATTSTLFKFQEEWIQAKKTAESLEAVREEFLLGASPAYRITATDGEAKVLQRKQALENFVIKVNELHLDQIDRWASFQLKPTDQLPLPATVQVDSVPNPSASFVAESSIALPAKRSSPSRPNSSTAMTTAFADDILSEDNLRVRPERELNLDPPQTSQNASEDTPHESSQNPGPFLI